MLFKKAFRDLLISRHSGTIPWLDVARSLAVILVVGAHSTDLGPSGWATRVFYWGWTGVDLFFVLSGFLIGRQLWSELNQTGTVRLGRFLLKRGFRIWPLYLSAVFAYFLWDCATHQSLLPLWSDLGYVSNYFHSRVKGGWSLSTEEQFYLLLPLVLLALKHVPIRWLFLLPVSWLALLPCLRAIQLAQHPGQPPGAVIFMPFHTHTDGLAAGLLLAWIAVVCNGWWNGSKGRLWLPLAIAATGLALRLTGAQVFSYTALALLYGALILVGVRRHRTVPLESWRGFHVLSRLSYGVYLNHLAIIESVAPYLSRHMAKLSSNLGVFSVTFVALWAASLALAFVTYSLIEKPFLDVRDRLLEAHSFGAVNPHHANGASTLLAKRAGL